MTSCGRQELDSPKREQQPRRATRKPKHDALDQHLPDQPPSAGAKGSADRDFTLTRRRSRQHQVGHVGAGDQKYESNGAKKNEERLLDVSDDLRVQCKHRCAGPFV